MLVELLGKAGRVCNQARAGEIRCPLIVRPTSEDQITGELFGVLRAINPRYWLSQLLNEALGARRFRQQVFRDLTIDLWVNQPQFPRDLLPWSEGSTQVDAVVTWENPPTTIFVEMKFTADLSSSTVGGGRQTVFPSDQLIRNARVGLWRTGWFYEPTLFDLGQRDFALILIAPQKGHHLVQRYRGGAGLSGAIPNAARLRGLPRTPFIGELGYGGIIDLLRRNRTRLTRPERVLADDLVAYLGLKLRQVRGNRGSDQRKIKNPRAR
jgi:hypothetical protein